MSDDIYKLKEDEQESFDYEKAHKDDSYQCGLIAGIVFILVGAGFLMSQTIGIGFHNWWALFILIPAGASLGRAWQQYQRHGRLDEASSGALMGGLCLLCITAIFLFGLSWSLLWPLVLIMIGVGALVKSQVA